MSEYRRLAAAVLVAHQRRADSNCLCGALSPGDSWSDHVAEILDGAGALRELDAPTVRRLSDRILVREIERRGRQVDPR